MEPLRIMPWNLAWRTSFAGHLLPLAPMDFLNPGSDSSESRD
jgi:hypothetical protein